MAKLLKHYEYVNITVEEIATTAHATVATFYKHFSGKRELLSALVDELHSPSAGRLVFPRSSGLALDKRITYLVKTVANATLRQRRVLRACIAARHRADLVLNAAQTARLQVTMQSMVDWLLESHAETVGIDIQVAVRAGVYLALQGLQTALLFEELPPNLSADVLTRHAEQMLLRFLKSPH